MNEFLDKITGVDRITPEAVRHLVEALEWDSAGERGSHWVPLSTYLTFAMPAYRERGAALVDGMHPPFPYRKATQRRSRALAVSVGVVAGVPMQCGDRISSEWRLIGDQTVSTRVGDGSLLDFEVGFFNPNGDRVATELTKVLSFEPTVSPVPVRRDQLAPKSQIETNAPDFDVSAPAAGQLLQGFTLPLTLQRLAMIVAANRDFAPIHYDPAAAAEIGAPVPVANSMVLLSFLERLLIDHGGPTASVRQLGPLRLKAPAVANGLLQCRGEVSRVVREGASLDVWVDATITVDDAVVAQGPGVMSIPGET